MTSSNYDRFDGGFKRDQQSTDSTGNYTKDDQYNNDLRTTGQLPFNQNSAKTMQNQNIQSNQNVGQADGIPMITPEDIRIMKECDRESFYKRCLPFAALGMLGLYAYHKTQNLPIKPGKYFGVSIVGWFLGKLNYRNICEDRLIQSASDSPFVKAIRRKRGIASGVLDSGTPGAENDINYGFADDTTPNTQFSEFSSASFPEYVDPFKVAEIEKSQFNQDDNFENQPTKSFTTYDDLRNKNRAGIRLQ